MQQGNLFSDIPNGAFDAEQFLQLGGSSRTLIERILSRGHKSAEHDWYDQERAEWVVLLAGAAELEFVDGSTVRLEKGDYLDIPAHCRHRVSWTSEEETCIWLAIHYQ